MHKSKEIYKSGEVKLKLLEESDQERPLLHYKEDVCETENENNDLIEAVEHMYTGRVPVEFLLRSLML
ncbi:MAG: hypothetical protein J4473_02270 [Candidatus Aenigmarchaeota archaeon]|nr:hypothetical protein [Candidatus Aenigmarchaeota archaeon]